MKKLLFFILTLSLSLTLFGCGKKDEKTTDLVKDSDWKTAAELISIYKSDDTLKVSEVKMTFEFNDDDGLSYIGYMTFLLFNNVAPKTVDNFVKLTEKGFYDNLTITRVVDQTLMQGGDPEKTTLNETKDSTNTIKGEFEENEVFNNLSHRRGVISMARASDFDSASSQFFVVNDNYTSGDGTYAAFGVLLEEKDENGNALSLDTRTFTYENGKRVLYDYDCLDMICNKSLDSGSVDAAPLHTIEIKKAEVLYNSVSLSTIIK